MTPAQQLAEDCLAFETNNLFPSYPEWRNLLLEKITKALESAYREGQEAERARFLETKEAFNKQSEYRLNDLELIKKLQQTLSRYEGALREIAYCVMKGQTYHDEEYKFVIWCKDKARKALKEGSK